MGLNRIKLSESRIETATPSGPEQRHARALVLFDKVLEKLEAEAASSVRGLLFVPGGLQTLGITDHEAAEILDFLMKLGILNNENNIAKVDVETIFNKKKDDFIAWVERDPSTAASPVAATVDVIASAPDALSSGEPDTALATGLDASTGAAPGEGSTSEPPKWEVGTIAQPKFADTPLGQAYIKHSTDWKNNFPEDFEREQELLTWMIETSPLDEQNLSFEIIYKAFTTEPSDNIIQRLKQRRIILEDPKPGTFLLPASFGSDQLRAKIFLAIHNLEDPDDPSATPKQLILRSVPSITTATTPASSPAAPDAAPKINVKSISNLIGSSSRQKARTILDKYFSNGITDSILNKIFVHTTLWDLNGELILQDDTLSKNFAGLDDFKKENLLSALSAIQDKVNQPPISLDTSAASAAAPSVGPTFTVPGSSPAAPDNFELSDENIEDLVKHFDTNQWSLSYMDQHLRRYAPGISEGYIRDFLKRAMAEHLIETGIDNSNQSFYRFNYNPKTIGEEARFIQQLKYVLRSLAEPVLVSSPGNNPDTTPDRRQQRTTSVTRLFSAVKGLAQKSPKITGAIACFVILGVGSAMYSGKEKAPEAKPAAGAQADEAPGVAAPQGKSREAAKTSVDAYKNAGLYRALQEGPKNTVDRLMTSTAEQFMMPYLNTVTIYQNSTPTTIHLNEASKKALFREMNIDGWKQLVKESYLQGPNNQQGAGDISLTDTDGTTYTNVYVRIDEQVARAFRDIRDVTMVVLKTEKKAPYPEGKIGDIYNDIKKRVADALK